MTRMTRSCHVDAAVAKRLGPYPDVRTRLAARRVTLGATQGEVARAVGLSISQYRRFEWGEVANPPLRTLVNLSIALRCELRDVCEPEWFDWYELSVDAKRPPARALGTANKATATRRTPDAD